MAFQYMVDHPFEALDISSLHFKLNERFTVILYDRISTSDSVNKARRERFSQKDRSYENLPPTQDALLHATCAKGGTSKWNLDKFSCLRF